MTCPPAYARSMAHGLGNSRADVVLPVCAQPLRQTSMARESLCDALLDKMNDIRAGGLGEPDRRGPPHQSRHVRYRVMDYLMLPIHGIVVGSGTHGFDTAALINRDVDDDTARSHFLDHPGCDHRWSAGCGNQHRSDQKVGVCDALLEIGGI